MDSLNLAMCRLSFGLQYRCGLRSDHGRLCFGLLNSCKTKITISTCGPSKVVD